MDRFILKINVPFPTEDELREIVLNTTSNNEVQINKIASGDSIQEIQKTIKEILVADNVLNYAVKIVLATHQGPNAIESINNYVRSGSGPRGVQALINVAKARAFLWED